MFLFADELICCLHSEHEVDLGEPVVPFNQSSTTTAQESAEVWIQLPTAKHHDVAKAYLGSPSEDTNRGYHPTCFKKFTRKDR